MPKVQIKGEDGIVIEADLTLAEIKQLMGVNGHNVISPPEISPESAKNQKSQKQCDHHELYRHISDRARRFLRILFEHTNGIEVNALYPFLGFKSASQIGGLTGPGLTTIAKKFGFTKSSDIYISQVTFPNGARTRMFYLGKKLRSLLDNDPPIGF